MLPQASVRAPRRIPAPLRAETPRAITKMSDMKMKMVLGSVSNEPAKCEKEEAHSIHEMTTRPVKRNTVRR